MTTLSLSKNDIELICIALRLLRIGQAGGMAVGGAQAFDIPVGVARAGSLSYRGADIDDLCDRIRISTLVTLKRSGR
jgi:hypothetical protein